MSTRGERWRHLGVILAGLVVGAICLVMWSSSSASALDAPPPTGSPASVDPSAVVRQLTGPVDELLAPTGLELAPVLDPVTEGAVDPVIDAVVEPTVATVDATLARLLPATPTAPGVEVPPLPQLPVLAEIPRMTPPGTTGGDGVLDGPPTTGAASTAVSPTVVADRVTQTADRAAVTQLVPTSGGAGSSSGPLLPAPADLLASAAGALTSAGQGSAGTVLLAVLAGTVVASTGPRPRRLALPGQLSPRAPAFAIVNPPG
jgi:hypothetical protein